MRRGFIDDRKYSPEHLPDNFSGLLIVRINRQVVIHAKAEQIDERLQEFQVLTRTNINGFELSTTMLEFHDYRSNFDRFRPGAEHGHDLSPPLHFFHLWVSKNRVRYVGFFQKRNFV